MIEGGELLGMSARSDAIGIATRRLGKRACATAGSASPPSRRRRTGSVADAGALCEFYWGWNVKHFHEHLVLDHRFRWGYISRIALAAGLLGTGSDAVPTEPGKHYGAVTARQRRWAGRCVFHNAKTGLSVPSRFSVDPPASTER
jgi:hypothetical protein